MALGRNLKFLRSQFFLTHPVHTKTVNVKIQKCFLMIKQNFGLKDNLGRARAPGRLFT